ncbi:unnamed protein product [Ascophyllum nodosum]
MSVEETNRVRAMLGLKPLNVGGDKKTTADEVAVENMRRKREEEEKAKELREVEARLRRARTKRQLKEKLKGETLGEVKEGEEEVASAADWVKRSRKKAVEMEEERLLAKQRERILEEQDMELAGGGGPKASGYDADNLAGMKVTHGAEAFEAGDSVILTLKDQGILEEDEHGKVTGLAKEDDELENVAIKEAERRNELQKEAIRAKRGAYQAYDDEEFEGEIGPGAKRKVLSHYDEAKKEGPRLTLGQGGTARDGGSAGAARGEGNGNSGKVKESLKVDLKDASEYFTTEEMVKLKKPKKMRKKRLRKREEAGASSSLGLEAAIQDSSNSSAIGGEKGADHGSRAARAAKALASEAGESSNSNKRFERAVERAGARASEKLADSFSKPAVALETKSAPPPSADPMAFAEELDTDLGVSLARARRLVQMKDKARERKARDVGEVVREAMQRQIKAEPVESGGSQAAAAGVLGLSVKREDENGGAVVFTSTTEFTSRLEATLEERKRDNIAAAEAKQKKQQQQQRRSAGESMDVDMEEEENESAAAEAEASKKKSRWTTKREGEEDDEEPDAEELEEMLEGAQDGDSDEDEQMGFLHKQPRAMDGVAATLALLRPTGVLTEKFQKSGRAKDARKFHGETGETREERESGAKLEYRDKWGRELTRREAWRNVCYHFHGYGSAAKKQEKRIKQVEEEKKKERAMDLQRLKTLQQTQAITKQAYVVVQGGSQVGAALPPPPSVASAGLDLKKQGRVKGEAKP